MIAEFVKLNPAGNLTVIILDLFPRSLHSEIAAKVMDPCGLGAEQVGFAENPLNPHAEGRLQMMGGEFCGNATLAYAAHLFAQRKPEIGSTKNNAQVQLEVSGYDGLIRARVSKDKHGFLVSSPMPPPQAVEFLPFKQGNLALVHLPGISHAIVWDEEPAIQDFWEAVKICRAHHMPAFGVMFFMEEESHLVPLVRVAQNESLIWEGSCASGSVAAAAALAAKEKCEAKKLWLKQPRGTLEVSVDMKKGSVRASITGQVKQVAHGHLWLGL